jgi:hypothetical protein
MVRDIVLDRTSLNPASREQRLKPGAIPEAAPLIRNGAQVLLRDTTQLPKERDFIRTDAAPRMELGKRPNNVGRFHNSCPMLIWNLGLNEFRQ